MSKMCIGYPETPCPQLQKDFLIEVKEALIANGGAGFCAWEPFWVSANNQTLWGVGSNWENVRSEEHTSELQSRQYLVCRLLLEKKKKNIRSHITVLSQ